MAKYNDSDLKWITLHPNGKEEKPGIKVAINNNGKIVKGPKGVKNDINEKGGLKGANHIPLEELKNSNEVGKNNNDDDDFNYNFEDVKGILESDGDEDGGGVVIPKDGEFEGLFDDNNNKAIGSTPKNELGNLFDNTNNENSFVLNEGEFGDLLDDNDGGGEAVVEAPKEEVATTIQSSNTNNNNAIFNGDTTGGYTFPSTMEEVNSLKFIKKLGGASGAEAKLYQDANGNSFVMKRFDASDKVGQERIKEECAADAYYLAGGANVPNFKLYGDEESGYVKLSRFIPNMHTLGSVWHSASDELKAKITNNIRKDFALDVMAGAWDVLGANWDNILVDDEGNIVRCDNGGCFNRRAQGGEKPNEAWGNGHIDDLWTMRGKAPGLDGEVVNDDTHKNSIFGDITTHQLLSDIASRDWNKIMANLPPKIKSVMEKRVANALDYHGVSDNVVVSGKYGDGKHAEDITLNYHCLNKFGAMPGCKNKNIKHGKFGYCRDNNKVNSKPTLSDLFNEQEPKIEDYTNLPEPKIEDYVPSSNASLAESTLKTAGISINKHLFVNKDGSPNMSSVNAALNLKPKLEVVAAGNDDNAKVAQKMLDYVNKIEAIKEGGFKNLDTEMPHSPTGEVDLNSPEVKAKGQEQFNKAHSEWEDKIGDAQNQFAQAHKEWEDKESAAKESLKSAIEKWEKEGDENKFGFKNLTDCYEKFCMENHIESKFFWQMASAQGGNSSSYGSQRMKIIEGIAMGGDLKKLDSGDYIGFISSVKGWSKHNLSLDAVLSGEEFASYNEREKYIKAYNAMKALTHMILRHSTFVGNFIDKGVVRLCRTENKNKVISKYHIEPGKVTDYPMGTHESFGVFHTATPFNNEAVFCDVPYSRISSLYFLNDPGGDSMYHGDSENEAGVNAVGLPKVYWKKVSNGTTLTDAYDFVDKAFGITNPKTI